MGPFENLTWASKCHASAMDYERLVNRHKDAVYRQMIRYCGGDREDAEDVLAEALIRAYRSSESLQEETAFRSWLSTIGRRICIRLRHRDDLRPLIRLGAPELAEIPSNLPLPDAVLETEQAKAIVERGLERLSPEFRELLELRDLQGLSGEEAAERLGLSLAAQKSRLHRARKALRAALDAEVSMPV